MQIPRIPVATYRIQFHRDFRFTDARDLVPYLHELGITDLYASPRFAARKGSSHGYDVADPQRINSELGSEHEFEEMVSKLRHYGMGLLLDIVPNHMAASWENRWWRDVLENGPSSEYAQFFDIDWHPATTKAAFLQENKVLLPVLGDLYGNVLENQELVLRLDEAGFFIRYFDHKFPIDPRSYELILEQCLLLGAKHDSGTNPEASAEAGVFLALQSLLEEVRRLPAHTTVNPDEQQRRRHEAQAIKQQIWALYHSNSDGRTLLDECMRLINGRREEPASFDLLDRLLAAQPYRLAHWKIGMEEINYRRFFDVNDLVGLRVNDPRVFAERHEQILELVREGKVTGLRIDHIDGLYDPLGYLSMLQDAAARASSNNNGRLFILVEKILGASESLPEDWPVDGTTGYDFLNAVNALLIHPAGWTSIEEAYARFTGSQLPFAEICYAGNKKVMDTLFAGEVQALTHLLARLAAQNRRARDLPLYELVQLLIEVTACLPVYRTYLRDFQISASDRSIIERTLALARRRTSRSWAAAGELKQLISDDALAYLRRVLLLDPPFYAPEQKSGFLEFVLRWQQFTGPVMAKGLEDTASYVHGSLVSLSEVGGDPLREDLPLHVQAFHLFNQARQESWPATMNATSTHDTKRSEDVRARINVLSEMPDEWEACLIRWSRWNQAHRQTVDGHTVPSPAEESLLYQTLLGAWPLDSMELPTFPERVRAYVWKAAREAKVHTSWIHPNEAHENALSQFVLTILGKAKGDRFVTDFRRFQKKVAYYGAWNALSQTLLKIASPGFPDFYQGTELWNFSLVDPDNRRPVDFALRARMLEELQSREARDRGSLIEQIVHQWQDGRIKLFMTWKALTFRRAHAELFQNGEYLPLHASGEFRESVCAFARRTGNETALVAVPRLLTRVADVGHPPLGRDVWGRGALSLPRGFPHRWENIFTADTARTTASVGGRALRLADVFQYFPVAMLYAG
jgi:(1->4)-alpha-D-glucan 1-alpha-D-glucosylmutase